MQKSIVTKKEIKKIAALARISLTQEEQEKFCSEIDSILQYFKDLGDVRVENFQAFDHFRQKDNDFREDDIKKTTEAEREGIKGLFPKKRGDYLEVKAVLNL